MAWAGISNADFGKGFKSFKGISWQDPWSINKTFTMSFPNLEKGKKKKIRHAEYFWSNIH